MADTDSKLPKVLFLLGSLKSSNSSSRKLASLLKPTFEKYRLPVKEIVLAGKNIEPGLKTDQGDDFASIVEEMKKSDIIVFITPIWWGEMSSLLQRVVERLDDEDTLYKKGKQPAPFLGKAFGVVVSGAEDGSQAIIARLNGWASHYGFIVPPWNSFSYLGDVNEAVKAEGKLGGKPGTIAQDANVTASNLILAAVHGRGIKWVTHGNKGQEK